MSTSQLALQLQEAQSAKIEQPLSMGSLRRLPPWEEGRKSRQ